jgi:hypothetical protein
MQGDPVTFSHGQAEILSIYNYSIQRFISRMMKFVTSYYDWLYCNAVIVSTSPTGAPEPQQIKPLPPASLFTQWAQMAGWTLETFEYLNVCNCLCGNFCDFINLLGKLENSNKDSQGILDNLVLTKFLGNGCGNSPVQQGCGNLYTETDLVEFFGSVNFIIEILIRIVDITDNHDGGSEQILANLCSCLLESVSCTLNMNDNNCNNNDCWSFSSTTELDFAQTGGTQSWCTTSDSAKTVTHAIPLTNSVVISESYQQAIAAFVDFIQFILFDRDCKKNAFKQGCDECCTINAGDYENYMNARCRAATNNGNCVVCSSACRKYRKRDGYETAKTVLYSLRCFFGLLGIDRGSTNKYMSHVHKYYNDLASSLQGLYGERKIMKLYPDCAAPQFCCSTARAFDMNCCNVTNKKTITMDGSTTGLQVIINQVPSLDIRLPSDSCGVSTNSTWNIENDTTGNTCYPIEGYWRPGKGGSGYSFSTYSNPDDTLQQVRSGINTCVLSAPCCDTVSCSTASCFDNSDAYFSSVC